VTGERTSRAVIVWSEWLQLTGLWVEFNGDDPEALTVAEVESSLGERRVRSTLNDEWVLVVAGLVQTVEGSEATMIRMI
jgi:hypothetical protein